MDMDTFERLQAETRLRDALMRLEEAEETDDEEERGAEEEELECPFCGEEFDGVGLCLHIEDEHAAETKAGFNFGSLIELLFVNIVHYVIECSSVDKRNLWSELSIFYTFRIKSSGSDFLGFTRVWVCPICTDRVGMDLVGHMTSEHPSFFKGRWRNQRVSSGSPSSMYSALKKDAAHIQYRYGGSSRATSLNTVPDPLLSSFVGSFIDDDADSPKDAQEELLEKVIEKSDASEQKAEESAEEPLLPEEKEERTKRSQFVQGLVLSLMFDDIL
ncbi:hypothetical protein TRIUR3_29361 [Triticum urartu]|uniref:Uncharacterized protein n=1 Tax=Triticum urartu TaxID=4572 RepID=M7Z373_TRIUA|nr:hypothetical protein TRIUR3_29361 [Triticum urartu]